MTHQGPRRQSSLTPVIGEIVLLGQEGPRGTWPLGKIIDLKTSPDGAVRSAKILLPSGTEVLRPISLLYPLEVTDGGVHQAGGMAAVNDNVDDETVKQPHSDERQVKGEKGEMGSRERQDGPIAARTRARTINLTPTFYATTILMILWNFPLTDAKEAPMGTINLGIENVRLICEKKTELFSHPFEMKNNAVKRGPTAGSYVGQKCAAVTSDTMVTELGGEANKSPSYSFCSESSSCISSECFCSSAGLFGKTYAVPTSDTVFEVLFIFRI
jgi:hypothetical protein